MSFLPVLCEWGGHDFDSDHSFEFSQWTMRVRPLDRQADAVPSIEQLPSWVNSLGTDCNQGQCQDSPFGTMRLIHLFVFWQYMSPLLNGSISICNGLAFSPQVFNSVIHSICVSRLQSLPVSICPTPPSPATPSPASAPPAAAPSSSCAPPPFAAFDGYLTSASM